MKVYIAGPDVLAWAESARETCRRFGYLRWVADGKVTDGNAEATVADQYKVREETVRAWIDAWSDISLASHADYRPDDVVRQMKISGRQYRGL
jgi:hypothetical protein